QTTIMERGGLARWLLLGAGIFFLITFLPDLFGGGNGGVTQPPGLSEELKVMEKRGTPESCKLWSNRVKAVVSEHGASLTSLELLQAKYRRQGEPTDLVTTPDHPELNPLHFSFRNPAAAPKQAKDWQVDFDVLNWTLTKNTATVCEFSYRDDKVLLTKRIQVGDGPYELVATATVKNLAERPLRHALTVNTSDFRRDEEVENRLFTMNPLNTHVECVSDAGTAARRRTEDFEPKDFEDPEQFRPSPLNTGYWYEPEGAASVAAASNAYFTNALAAVKSPKGP